MSNEAPVATEAPADTPIIPLAQQSWEEFHLSHPDRLHDQYLRAKLSDIQNLLVKKDELSQPVILELQSKSAAKTLAEANKRGTPIPLADMSFVQATVDRPMLLREANPLETYLSHSGEAILRILEKTSQVTTIDIQSFGKQLADSILNEIGTDPDGKTVPLPQPHPETPRSTLSESVLKHAEATSKLLRKRMAIIGAVGLSILGLVAAGVLAYEYINTLPGNIHDIAAATQQELNRPALTHTPTPSELPPTLTSLQDDEPTLAYAAPSNPPPTLEETPESSGNDDNTPKHSFKENIVDIDPATYSHVGLSENTLLCLQENGDTFAKEINTVPIQIDSPIIGCAVMHEGQVRAININNASGDQLKVVVDSKGHIEVQIGTSTLSDLKTFRDWGWVGRPGFEDTVRINSNVLDWIKNYLQAQKDNLYVIKIAGQERSGKVVMGQLP